MSQLFPGGTRPFDVARTVEGSGPSLLLTGQFQTCMLSTMARPREYDEDQVLEAAMQAFWTRGYEATSMADLMEATGLAKGSVYKGFRDKHAFFMRALERYLARGRARLASLMDDDLSAHEMLGAWLAEVLNMNFAPGVRKGCFKINCSVELAPHDVEVRKLLRAHERALEAMMAKTVARGVREGSLREDIDPQVAARWLETVIAGIAVSAKTGMTRAEAEAMTELALRALRR